MVVLDSKLNILRFAHVSVQKILETQPDLATHHAHRLAAMGCLDMFASGTGGWPLSSGKVLSLQRSVLGRAL